MEDRWPVAGTLVVMVTEPPGGRIELATERTITQTRARSPNTAWTALPDWSVGGVRGPVGAQMREPLQRGLDGDQVAVMQRRDPTLVMPGQVLGADERFQVRPVEMGEETDGEGDDQITCRWPAHSGVGSFLTAHAWDSVVRLLISCGTLSAAHRGLSRRGADSRGGSEGARAEASGGS